MSSITTRFCPTLDRGGDLHVGHLVNLYSNLFFAKKHNGNFFVFTEGYEKENASQRNLAVIKHLLPDCRIVNFHYGSCGDRLRERLFDVIGEEGIFDLPQYTQGHFWQTIQEYFLNVNVLIRGADWTERPDGFAEFSQYVLEQLYGHKIEQYFHPLLFDKRSDNPDKKISKSLENDDAKIINLLERGVSRLGLLVYILNLFEDGQVDPGLLLSYHQIFDIGRLSQRIFPSYDINTLLETDIRIKRKTTNVDSLYSQLVKQEP